MKQELSESPENVARAFLAALDERRWHDAAALVDSQTRETFQRRCIQWIEWVGRAPRRPPEDVASDTQFTSLLETLGLASAAEAANLTSTDLLARFAEGAHPGNLHPQLQGDFTDGSTGRSASLVRSWMWP